ncbi:hypothetical protein [Cytobacillus firmus]|uniref:hypothetical protein n=1 Tax=Cytobacillus firmus TaxID=1399 RepID=UPI0018CF33DD|nr:hypothetical protein [Cytobacillus firmus]
MLRLLAGRGRKIPAEMWDLQAYFAVSPAKVGHLQAKIKDLSAKLNDGRTIFRLSVTSSALSVIILIYRLLFNFIGQFLHYFGHF